MNAAGGAAKQEALARMAAAIAHDLNNGVTTILGNNAFLLDLAGQNPTMLRHVERIERAAERLLQLADNLTACAATGHPPPTPVNPIPLLNTLLDRYREQYPSITIVQDVDPACPPALVAEDGLAQALDHLLTNAVEALDDARGHLHIRLTTTRLTTDNLPPCPPHAPLKPGPYVTISITDSGHGIAPDLHDRLFDPCFTTKLRGKGMGLAITLGLLRMSHGSLCLSSTPGQGTTATLYLPAQSACP